MRDQDVKKVPMTAHDDRVTTATSSPSRNTRNHPPPSSLPKSQRNPTSTWRQEALARAAEIEIQLSWMKDCQSDPHLVQAVYRHLEDAREAVYAKSVWTAITGAETQRALYSLDAADVTLLRLADRRYLASVMPELVASAMEALPSGDPRLHQLILRQTRFGQAETLSDADAQCLIAAVSATKKAALRAQNRVRSFRNVLLATTVLVTVVTCALLMVGAIAPDTLPLCQTDPLKGTTCPASGTLPGSADIFIVMFAGILGATISAVFALKNVRGTPDPYSVPFVTAILKLPTGALTAVMGLLLIRGGFTPGFTGLDSAAQIIAYSIVFGYAQHLFTSFVDRQANSILSATPSAGSPLPPIPTEVTERPPQPAREQVSAARS
jgi:hypothetical protein